jgi:hypothetical protein
VFDEVGGKGRLNTIVAVPIERDNFVEKYLSCPVAPTWHNISIFQRDIRF